MRYEIVGSPFPVVVCYMESGESMLSDSGSMAWMESVYGYGNNKQWWFW